MGKISDYFAELYVAGRLADAGWNVYFPHRDEGLDFIIAKRVEDKMIVRPVQVKGKYPRGDKTDKDVYGYVGRLTEVHPEMVLAIPYFLSGNVEATPLFVAYCPYSQVRRHSRGYRCQPACFKSGKPMQRREYSVFFDTAGIRRLELEDWSKTTLSHKGSSHAND